MPPSMRLALVLPVLLLVQSLHLIAQQPPDAGWVSLPVAEYQALRERANPTPRVAPPTRPGAVITRADYDLRAGDGTATGTAAFTIDVLTDGWSSVELPPGLMVSAARVDGQPVPLLDRPSAHVLFSRAGRFVLSLDVVVPLASAAGTESFTVPASSAAISHVVLTVPATGVELVVSDGFVSDHVESSGESRWTAFGRSHQPLTVSWKRRADDRRADLPLRLRGRLAAFVTLGEDGAQVTASARVEVLQGLARTIAVRVPTGLVVNQVDGPTVAEWTVSNGVLAISLLGPAGDDLSFVIRGESHLPRDGEVAIPVLRLESVERETGGVVVEVVGAGEVAGQRVEGFEAADASEFADVLAGRESPSMAAFRLRAGSGMRALSVNVVRYTPQAVLIANVEHARYRTLLTEDGRLLMEASYLVRNNQRSFLKVTPPAGAAVWSVSVAGRPVRPGVADATGVLVPLDKGRQGDNAPASLVSLVYLQEVAAWDRSGRTSVELPAVDLPISRMEVEFHYPPRYSIEIAPGMFRATNSAPTFDAVRPPPPPPPAPAERAAASGGLQALVDRFANEGGGRAVAGTLPVQIAFPDFGPATYLAAELTEEAQVPNFDLSFRRVSR